MKTVRVLQSAGSPEGLTFTVTVTVGEDETDFVFASGREVDHTFFCDSVTVARSGESDVVVTPADHATVHLNAELLVTADEPPHTEQIMWGMCFFAWVIIFYRFFRQS